KLILPFHDDVRNDLFVSRVIFGIGAAKIAQVFAAEQARQVVVRARRESLKHPGLDQRAARDDQHLLFRAGTYLPGHFLFHESRATGRMVTALSGCWMPLALVMPAMVPAMAARLSRSASASGDSSGGTGSSIFAASASMVNRIRSVRAMRKVSA